MMELIKTYWLELFAMIVGAGTLITAIDKIISKIIAVVKKAKAPMDTVENRLDDHEHRIMEIEVLRLKDRVSTIEKDVHHLKHQTGDHDDILANLQTGMNILIKKELMTCENEDLKKEIVDYISPKGRKENDD